MVYLDRFTSRGNVCGHLFTDNSFPELHAFAVEIGLRREWFQGNKKVPHYDVIGKGKCLLALKHGAVSCGRRGIILKGLRRTMTEYTRILTAIPTNDSNFEYALKRYATDDEIVDAIEIMRASPAGNKSRIAACERELRRRANEAAKKGGDER